MTYLFANNARSTLASGINDSVTALSVQTGDGLLFPNPTGVEEFRCVLYNDAGAYEIIKVTTRATDAFSVIVRGQEGTSPAAWSADDYVSLRTTKESLEYLLQHSDVDDTPVDTATDVPVSSNWAFDHAADTDAHGGPYNNYVHPSHDGDDIDADTTLLSGATVISDLDFNITTDTLGHVTDATLTALDTRELAPSDIGASADTHDHDSDYISVVTTPTTGNFPQLTAGGELVNSTYDETSFATAGHTHDTYDRASSVLADANVFSNIVVTDGITTDIATRALTSSDIGALAVADIDDTPVDNVLDAPISSNRAYEHENGISGKHPSGDITYDNAVSGLTATDVKAAVDEVAELGIGKKTLWFPIGSAVLPATNPAALSVETINSIAMPVLSFDTTTQEKVYFQFIMPNDYEEGVTPTLRIAWSHPATTVNFGAVFGGTIYGASDGELAGNTSSDFFGAVDTGGTTDTIYIVDEPASLNLIAKGDACHLLINRQVSSGSDDLAVDARIHSISLEYTTDQANED